MYDIYILIFIILLNIVIFGWQVNRMEKAIKEMSQSLYSMHSKLNKLLKKFGVSEEDAGGKIIY